MTVSLKALAGCALLLVIVLTSGCSGNDSDQQSPPNILLILTDDLGVNDIGSWGDGTAPTPTLDQLSSQSIRFRQHYTDSTCSPSRAALLTGQHPVSVGFQADGLGFSSDLETLPKSLKKLGYRTVHIGKWHVGEALEYPEIQPGNQGFDYWLGMLNHFVLQGPGPNGEIIQRQPTHINPWLQENGAPPTQHLGYLDDILTDAAIAQMSKGNQPWFINLWLFSPHTPYQPSPKFSADFPDTPEGNFLSILKHVDFNVSTLLEALKRKGLADNTIVIFASDNGGPNIARDNNYPLLGKKAQYLDGGVRNPLLIYWPSQLKSKDILAPTHITDIYPTLVSLAGGKPPQEIMGRNLHPLLRGGSLQSPVRFFWMADLGLSGMIYAEHLLESRRYFFRRPQGFQQGLIAPPIGHVSPSEVPEAANFSVADGSKIISIHENAVRTPPFHWKQNVETGTGQLSGLDFQRAPTFGGFSIGLSIDTKSGQLKGTLLDQKGIWQIEWMPDQRLRIRVGNVVQLSEPIPESEQSCNSLVISTRIKPASSFPFPGPAASVMNAYWNEQIVLESTHTLSRPESAEPLKNPTWIGNSDDGKHPFTGKILGKPIVINKFLMTEQEGYKLSDLTQTLCPK